jgi:hypothetical protein
MKYSLVTDGLTWLLKMKLPVASKAPVAVTRRRKIHDAISVRPDSIIQMAGRIEINPRISRRKRGN